MTLIFVVLQALLKAFGLWEQFQDYIDKSRIAENELKRQEIEKAVEDLKNAKTPEDIFKAEERITRNLP